MGVGYGYGCVLLGVTGVIIGSVLLLTVLFWTGCVELSTTVVVFVSLFVG